MHTWNSTGFRIQDNGNTAVRIWAAVSAVGMVFPLESRDPAPLKLMELDPSAAHGKTFSGKPVFGDGVDEPGRVSEFCRH